MDTNRHRDEALSLTPVEWARMPIRERLLDRLGDLLLGADDVLGLLANEDAAAERWIVSRVTIVYDEVNSLMKKLAD